MNGKHQPIPQNSFEFRADPDKLFYDLLRRILLRVLPPNADNLLALLKKTHYEEWRAVDCGDEETTSLMRSRKEELVDKLIALAARQAGPDLTSR